MKNKKMSKKSIVSIIENITEELGLITEKEETKRKTTTFIKNKYPLWKEVSWYFKGKKPNKQHKQHK
jgi:hypothetical protein